MMMDTRGGDRDVGSWQGGKFHETEQTSRSFISHLSPCVEVGSSITHIYITIEYEATDIN